jgi:hypothetical protein
MTRRLIECLLLVSFLGAGPALAQQVKGQKPVLLIDGTFQFQPGSWARYLIHDKKAGEYYLFTLSVLNEEQRKNRPCTWLEIEVTTPGEYVVTRVLVEKTTAGPGDLMAAVVWVEGFTPFSLPEKFLKAGSKDAPQFTSAHVAKRVEQRPLTFDGQSLPAILVEAQDDKGDITRAMVSTSVAPMALLWADNPEIAMYLDDWGSGAVTKITQKPIGFFEWIALQVSRAMGGEDVSLRPRQILLPDVDGVWEERDGACPGSRWNVAASADRLRLHRLARCQDTLEDLEGSGVAAGRAPVRVLTATLGGSATNTGTDATVMFYSRDRAVVALRNANGLSLLSVLGRSAR